LTAGKSNTLIISRPVADKQKMRPGSWFGQCFVLPSVLLHYWLGNSKNNQLIKTTCFFSGKGEGKIEELANSNSNRDICTAPSTGRIGVHHKTIINLLPSVRMQTQFMWKAATDTRVGR